MNDNFLSALKKRRSNYDLTKQSDISDSEIQNIIGQAISNVPSAFNSQSARVVLLFGNEHEKLWKIILETLRERILADNFTATEDKIASFAAGYGTVLFFEDLSIIRELQQSFPSYHDAFPWFSANSAGMLQLAVWTMLREAGLGASLQHYGNLIHTEVSKEWGLGESWMPVAQMPFGKPASEPAPKEKKPLSEFLRVFG